MSRILFFSTVIFTMLTTQVSAQVIDLDEEQEVLAQDKFEKSTMYYISPGSFNYQMGYGNMLDKLENSLGLNPSRFTNPIAVGLGWRRKVMFYNLLVATPVFTYPIVETSGNVKTVAELSTTYAELTVGRAVVSNDRYNLILKGGVGFFGSQVQIREYSSGSFDLDNPGLGLGTAWPLLEHYSGTFDIAFEYVPQTLRPLSIMPSFQLGYKAGIGSSTWGSSDAVLANSISDRVSLIYLRVSLVISRQY